MGGYNTVVVLGRMGTHIRVEIANCSGAGLGCSVQNGKNLHMLSSKFVGVSDQSDINYRNNNALC